MEPTRYPDVNELLADYQNRLAQILDKQLVGIYLAGSLVTGDFNPNSSDIDVLVATASELSDETVSALFQMHTELHALDTKWGVEIEAGYIPLEALHRYDPTHAIHPHIERGDTLRVEHLGTAWIIQRFIVREFGMVLHGPDPQTLIEPISAHELKQATREIFYRVCYSQIENPRYLDTTGSISYIVLTVCRVLYTLAHATIISKPRAAQWVLANLDKPFGVVIEQALTWTQTGLGATISQAEVIGFIRYADRQIQASEDL